MRTNNPLCGPCSNRTCPDCGKPYVGNRAECSACAWQKLPPEVRAARGRKWTHARRARKQQAEIAGPVSEAVYLALRAQPECVYCGAEPTTVDHIVPLSREGWEHPSNLVPCCSPCNSSKGDRLLVEWDRARVERAAGVSVLVAAAWCAVRPA